MSWLIKASNPLQILHSYLGEDAPLFDELNEMAKLGAEDWVEHEVDNLYTKLCKQGINRKKYVKDEEHLKQLLLEVVWSERPRLQSKETGKSNPNKSKSYKSRKEVVPLSYSPDTTIKQMAEEMVRQYTEAGTIDNISVDDIGPDFIVGGGVAENVMDTISSLLEQRGSDIVEKKVIPLKYSLNTTVAQIAEYMFGQEDIENREAGDIFLDRAESIVEVIISYFQKLGLVN